MLPAYKLNLAEVSGTTLKVERAWV